MKHYHTGTVVADLDASVASYSSLGMTFTRTRRVAMRVDVAGTETEVELHVAYSTGGEPHLELVQEIRGDVWARSALCLDHIGVWTTDMLADIERCRRAGFTLGVSGIVRDGQRAPSFAYLRSPGGLWTELVAVEGRPPFEKWLETTHRPNDWFEM